MDENCVSNDFTSISQKGSSVVDYCLMSHDALDICSGFEVVHVIDLIARAGNVSSVAPSGIPDHSVLRWNIGYWAARDG